MERARGRQVVSDFSALRPRRSKKTERKTVWWRGGKLLLSSVQDRAQTERLHLVLPQERGGGGGGERCRLRTKSHLAASVGLHARGTRNRPKAWVFLSHQSSPNSH